MISSPLPVEGDHPLVLKPAIGSGGRGITLVTSSRQALDLIQADAERARAEPRFLDQLRAMYGRVPGWVLQEHVASRLVRGGRKFHVRVYVVIHQQRAFLYNTTEVRIAAHPSPGTDWDNRSAHITNGAGGDATDRRLWEEVDELHGKENIIRQFVCECCQRLAPSMRAQIQQGAQDPLQVRRRGGPRVQSFVLGALDLMVDELDRVWLLEINRNPCPPSERVVSFPSFRRHLIVFAASLASLLLLSPTDPSGVGFIPLDGAFCPVDQMN